MRAFKSCLAALFGVLLLGAQPAGADFIFSDADFIGSWSDTVIAEPDHGTVSSIRHPLGGNSANYRRTELWNTQPGTWEVTVASLRGPAVYDPSVDGAISSLSFSMDANRDGRGNPAAVGLLLFQNNTYYTSGYATPLTADTWQTISGSGLTALSFSRITGAGPINPDFSSTGGAIQFGYVTDVDVPTDEVILNGVDNWSVSGLVAAAAETPEPGSMALFGLGVLGLAAVRRKRRGTATEAGSEE